jgi:hypothetical protein
MLKIKKLPSFEYSYNKKLKPDKYSLAGVVPPQCSQQAFAV